MSDASKPESEQDPGPVKSSDAERVTGAESGKAPGQEPEQPARSENEEPPGHTPTDED